MSGAASFGRAASWSVVCDFDGTVSRDDITDSLLLRFARPGWQELEAAWQAGRIGSRACMAGQVSLLDCSRGEFDAHVAAMQIDPQFGAFVDAVHADGASLTIASDGLDAVIEAMLTRAGLAGLPVRASRLVQTGAREWALQFPHGHASSACASATCKCASLPGDPGRRTLLVGDGASDFCVAAHADLTFAKSRLLGHCVAHGIPHRSIADFGDALVAWRELVDADEAPAAPVLCAREAA